MKFKGFGDWIEIFKGGEQTDSEGRKHDGDKVIDRVMASFNAKAHEPPIVVGHPKDNAPAFGWVSGLKEGVRDGARVLLMKARQVVPEFEQAVKAGHYKKRSIAVYPDGRLRHVAFLGAAPPAVKGLADLSFEDDEGAITFSAELGDASYDQSTHHSEGGGMDKFKEVVEFLKFWKTEGRELLGEPVPADGKTFSEEDVKAREEEARKKAAEEAKTQAEAEYAEKEREAAKSRRGEEIAAFCEQSLKDGKIAPSWLKLGLKEFMESLDAEETVQFSEGDQGKASRYDWFKGFLEELPKVVEFKEVAGREDGGAAFAEKKEVETGNRLASYVNPRESE